MVAISCSIPPVMLALTFPVWMVPIVPTDSIGLIVPTILSGHLDYVGTIVGTIGTIQSGNVSASITGGILQDIATIGTIVSGYVSADRIFKQTNVVTSAF